MSYCNELKSYQKKNFFLNVFFSIKLSINNLPWSCCKWLEEWSRSGGGRQYEWSSATCEACDACDACDTGDDDSDKFAPL